MSASHIRIESVNLRLQGGPLSQQAAATIGRLIFRRVQETMAQRGTGLGKSRSIDLLKTRPVSTASGASHEAIAQAAAAEICRALRES